MAKKGGYVPLIHSNQCTSQEILIVIILHTKEVENTVHSYQMVQELQSIPHF